MSPRLTGRKPRVAERHWGNGGEEVALLCPEPGKAPQAGDPL